ncbi:MAG TPA: aspartate--tRNA ligase [Clostridia bacterium]
MAENIVGMKRTGMCAELGVQDVGRTVTLMGWCHRQRDLGGLVFILLRDRSGEIQLVADDATPPEARDKAVRTRSEYVLAVTGVVSLRSAPNPEMQTGQIEVAVRELRILSESLTPPFYIDEDAKANEPLRLKYRYLDLRRPNMQRNLILRHRVARMARDYFDGEGFLEIETPMLIRSTPEGARDYLVPSRVFNGRFFALPQSPQLFKQLLMVGGYDRYMQIARCFRDEDLRADRQPEFTQIDLEMSFVDADEVMAVNEGFLRRLFREILDVEVTLPLPRLTYAEAMERFGSDKPDLRFDMELRNLSDLVADCEFTVFRSALENGGCVRGIAVPGGASMSRKEIDALAEVVKTYRAKGLAWITLENPVRGSASRFLSAEIVAAIRERFDAHDGDLVLMVADTDTVAFDALGALRCEVARQRGMFSPKEYRLLWVTEFPLLEYDAEAGRYAAKHHPFTSPMDEDVPLLDTDPSAVRAKAYDIVLNGTEVGGGSIRIHDPALQRKMFSLLGFSQEQAERRFGFLLDAFQYGVPPHGGLAYGLDRLVMLLTGCDNIREVIAFPKVQNSSCLMTEAPGEVDDAQLAELGLKIDTESTVSVAGSEKTEAEHV